MPPSRAASAQFPVEHSPALLQPSPPGSVRRQAKVLTRIRLLDLLARLQVRAPAKAPLSAGEAVRQNARPPSKSEDGRVLAPVSKTRRFWLPTDPDSQV